MIIRKISIILCLCMCTLFFIHGNEVEDAIIYNNTNSLMSSFIPIRYGEEDFVRRISERTNNEREPIGLLLSGGSARAFAHIGVIEYLEELEIVPDYIISNSMGSIVGILYAAGLNSEQLYDISRNLEVSTLFGITLPISGGVLDNSKFVSFLTSYIEKGKLLEDLEIPIMVITEDIATKRQVRLMEGDIEKVLGASFAIPVYFPPVEFRGHMLIDGGLINLAPVEIGYEYGENMIVSSTFYEGKGINLKDPLSILNLSIDIGKRRGGATSLASYPQAIWIRCDVEDFSFMAFDKVEELKQKGYESASLMGDELKQLANKVHINNKVLSLVDFDKLHRSILDNYSLFHSIKTSGISQQLFTGIKNFNHQKDQKYLLRDENIVGVRYTLSLPIFETSVLAGVAWSNSSFGTSFADALVSLTFTPFSFIALEGDLLLSTDDSLAPRYYQRAELKIRSLFNNRSILAEVFTRFEGQNDIKFSTEENLVDSGVSLWYRGQSEKPTDINSRVSYQLTSSFTRKFLNSAFALKTHLTQDFLIIFDYQGRYALDGGGDVPFYASDGYYSTHPVLLKKGRGGAFNSANYLITAGLEFNFAPQRFVPSLAETVLLKGTSMGVFGQAIWFEKDTATPHFIFGLKTGTTLSLLGLKELPTSLYVAFDTLAQGITFGINLGVTTWK